MEVWKDIKGFEVTYQISNLGRVYNKNRENILDGGDNGNGYLVVGLYNRGDQSTKIFYRHRLVAQNFILNPDNLPQVGHRDDDKNNNSHTNLYWCSGSRNIRDAHKSGRMDNRKNFGTYEEVLEWKVVEMYCKVKFEGQGITQTAKAYDVPRTTLSSIMNKRSRKSITDPLDWEFT